MKRLSAATAGWLLAAMLLSAANAAGVTVAPRAQLSGLVCRRALDPPNRAVSVTAVMRPLAGTVRMRLKFDLLLWNGSASASAPSMPREGDLGVWLSPPDATLGQRPADVWRFDKSVVQLPAPATYRFRVSFRWIGADRRVIGAMVAYSRPCQQRELRPDLLVEPITVSPISASPDQDLYTAVVSNVGASAAGPFDVLFAPADGSPPQTHTVQRLKGRSERTETFVGPVCTAASAPTITADSADQVDDLDRTNNAITALCPAPASPTPRYTS